MKKILISLFFFVHTVGFSQRLQQCISELQAVESDFIQAKNSGKDIDKYIDNQFTLLEKGEVKQVVTFGFEKIYTHTMAFPFQVGIAESGDFGYTLSAWKSTVKIPETGTSLRIWRKTNAKWKVIVQMNITYPALSINCYESFLPVKPSSDFDLSKNKTLGTEQLLFMKDYYYTKNAKTSPNPFEPSLSKEVLILEENKKSIFGKENADKWLKVNFSKTEIQTVFKAVASASGDLAVTYGTTQTQTNKGNFLRIWREEAKDIWKIVLEIKK